MNRLRDSFAIIASIAAVGAVLGMATLNDAAMGIGGIVAALAAIAWGLVAWIEDRIDDLDIADQTLAEYRAEVWQRRDSEDELELPYLPPAHAPHWDTDIHGAPE